MTDYKALKRALELMGLDFDDEILHDGKRSVLIASPPIRGVGHLASLAWHFDPNTEEYVGSFIWNQSESLGFDEEGKVACFCERSGRTG